MGQNPDAQSIQSDIQRSLSFVVFYYPICSSLFLEEAREARGRKAVCDVRQTPALS